MKKLIFIAAFAACAFGLNAQLNVNKSGNVTVGAAYPWSSATTNSSQKSVNISPSLTIQTDSVASMNILRSSSQYGVGAYITFGNLRNVGIVD